MQKKICVGLVQQNCTIQREACLQTTIGHIQAAAAQGAQVVCLQELHTSIYFCQTENAFHFSLAETIPGPTTDELAKIAIQHNIVIIASLFEKRAPGLYHNTAVVLDSDGSIAGTYRKMHIPDDPNFYEKFYFTPGDLGFSPIQTSLGKLGILICWDQWYPEAARLMALAGAELLFYPTAIGWFPHDQSNTKIQLLDNWITIQRSHAIANAIPVISCNRVGHEADPSGTTEGIEFWGNSFIINAMGTIIASAPRDTQAVLVAELDLSATERIRQDWPFLRDRRIDTYQDLLKRYGK